jgi:transcriptional regulator with XRE-family HTH domain
MPRSTKPRRTSSIRAKPRRADPQDVAYLHSLADKIRDARAQRGMTRNALAADSGVSLRFLAQLEGGQGNPSILVLRRIASAMDFPPDDLLSNDPPPAIDRILLMQMLKRLSDDDIAKARRVLTQHLGLDAASEAKRRYVTLIGLRGAGKTTLGRRLAKCVFQRSWTVIPGHRGQRPGVGGDRRRFFSGVHDGFPGRRFFSRRHPAFHCRSFGSGDGPLRGSDSRSDSPLVFNSIR